MFYDAVTNRHGLPHDPFKSLIAPRPIGWISTLDEDGNPNLAPYSFFNGVSNDPHIVLFSSDGYKDSLNNAQATGEFVCSLATFDLRDAMNATSAPAAPGQSEFDIAGLTPAPSRLVKPPRVGESPVALECIYLRTVELTDKNGNPGRYHMALGQVIGIYIDDDALTDGLVDTARIKPIARLGYMEYAAVDKPFVMRRPKTA